MGSQEVTSEGEARASDGWSGSRTPWKRIAAGLRAAIARGDYPPGSRLPSIPELCAAHGTGRGAAAKALRGLAEAGLAELEPGLGYYVPGAPDGPAEIVESSPLRW
jgi:DNA-binding GntR family transcriptional regulator